MKNTITKDTNMLTRTNSEAPILPASNWRIEGEGGASAGGGLLPAVASAVNGAVTAGTLAVIIEEISKGAATDEFWEHPYKWCANDMSGKSKNYGLAVLAKVQAKFQTKKSEVTKGDNFIKTWSKADKKALATTLTSFDSVEEMTAYMETYEVNGTTVPFIPGSTFIITIAQIAL